jgi:type II restriction enzyme
VKLGKWGEFLAMRDGVVRLNNLYHQLLSSDLGAIGGLLFDIGAGHYAPPPRGDDAQLRAAWERDLANVRELTAKEHKELLAAREGDCTHTEVQGWLRDLGKALGFDVWIAANDRARLLGTGKLGDGCLATLPSRVGNIEGADAVRLIDVLWLAVGTDTVVAAFEVEHTTSIYSGIVRLLDLSIGVESAKDLHMFLVAPGSREQDVRDQLLRPAFRNVNSLKVKFLPYGALQEHRESIARFGTGMKAIEAIARPIAN